MYDLQTNILSKSNKSAADLTAAAAAISSGNLLGAYAASMLQAEQEQGINAVFIMAHAAIESAWGHSYFATARNNLFGIDAYDSDPNKAIPFSSYAACIQWYAAFLKKYYLTPGGAYYNGSTPHGVFVKYSSSHDSEAQNVVNLMNQIAQHGGEAAPQVPTSDPQTAPPAAGEHDVTSGETLYSIAVKNGTTVDAIISANKARYPSIGTGIAAHLEAGWRILVPGQANVPTPIINPVYITVPSGPNGYLSNIAAAYGTTVDQIISWNKGKYPEIGTNKKNAPSFVAAGWTIRVK